MPPLARPLLTGVRFRYEDGIHRTPPLSLIPPGLRLRGRMAPVDQTFRSWVTDHSDERTADFLSSLAGVYLEHGFEKVEDAVVAAFEGRIGYALNTHVDHKTELQEALARLGR